MQSIHRYPTDDEAKKLIVEIGRRMYQKNFVAANDGNISCKVDDDIIWTTPHGRVQGLHVGGHDGQDAPGWHGALPGGSAARPAK